MNIPCFQKSQMEEEEVGYRRGGGIRTEEESTSSLSSSPSLITMVQTPQQVGLGDRVKFCSTTLESQNHQGWGMFQANRNVGPASSSNCDGCVGRIGIGGMGSNNDNNRNQMSFDDDDDIEDDDDDDDPTLLIAKEMHRLSLKEREQAYEDLHGVSVKVQETPELIKSSLRKMKEQINKIPTKYAYDLVMKTTNQNSITSTTSSQQQQQQQQEEEEQQYVTDPNLWIIFLRADRFDIEKSSKRFLLWLDWKLQLFGRDMLCQRYIRLDDLNHDTKLLVEAGVYQILPSRDSRGRAVVVVAGQYRHRFFRSIQSALQMFFYLHMCLIEDENNQKNGLVYIIYMLGKENDNEDELNSNDDDDDDDAKRKSFTANTTTHRNKNSSKESADDLINAVKISQLFTALPIPTDGMHFVTQDTGGMAGVFFPVVVKSLTQSVRARFRVHFGSHLECEYALLSFGLPSSLLPFTTEGELRCNNHKKWIQRRRVKDKEVPRGISSMMRSSCSSLESKTTTTTQQQQPVVGVDFSGIDLPCRNDVLLGQGKPTREHPGNQRLHELMKAYCDEYSQAHKNGGRTIVARKIVHEIQNPSSSFSSSSCPGSSPSSPTTNTTTSSSNINLGVGGSIGSGGGRFLKRPKSGGWWEEVTDEDILVEKVCLGLRNVRKRR